MQIILNELSLEKKFTDLTDFLKHLREILAIYKLGIKGLEIYKQSTLYDIVIFGDVKFLDVLRNRQYSRSDEIQRYKRAMDQMISHEPFWDLDMRHSDLDKYNCDYTEKKGFYGIAEACERDKVVLSFNCEEFFECQSINVIKNGVENLDVVNIYSQAYLIEYMKDEDLINPLLYCKIKYKESNLCFDKIDENESFNKLTKVETSIFLNIFEQFSKMEWSQITSSDGLRYKPYSPSNEKESWFKGTSFESKNISKFRVNQKFRCFGYREQDKFYVLRFETDHKISDNG